MSKQAGAKSELLSWLKAIVFAAAIAFLCRYFLFAPTLVHGESMAPTYENNDRLIMSKMSSIERSDIIVFHAPDADQNYIKRVIGLPGDTIAVKDHVLYVNGKAVDEDYLPSDDLTNDFTLEELTGDSEVPENSLFVMGDNRSNSKDSRIFGFISEDAVIGEVKATFFPFNHIELTD